MTDDQIYEECQDVWVQKTGRGWTFEEFKLLLGYLGEKEETTIKCGEVVTGGIISDWYSDWRAFSHGWISAYKHLGLKS